MKRKYLFIVLILACGLTKAQVAERPIAAPLKIETDRVADALEKFAAQTSVQMGFEQDTYATEVPIKISMEKGTVKDFLQSVVAANPSYTWLEQDGVIDVVSVRRSNSFLDVTVARCDLIGPPAQNYDVYFYNMFVKLVNTPEAKQWSERTGTIPRFFLATSIMIPGQGAKLPATASPVTRTLTNITTRTYMNELMKAAKSHFWVYSIYGDKNQYFDLRVY